MYIYYARCQVLYFIWVTTRTGLCFNAQKHIRFSDTVSAPVSLRPRPEYPVCSDWSAHTRLSNNRAAVPNQYSCMRD